MLCWHLMQAISIASYCFSGIQITNLRDTVKKVSNLGLLLASAQRYTVLGSEHSEAKIRTRQTGHRYSPWEPKKA